MAEDATTSICVVMRRKIDGAVTQFATIAELEKMWTIGAFIGQGFQDVALERIEQIEEHGFDLEHDLGHHPATLASGAASYLNTAIDQLRGVEHDPQQPADTWPWEREAWRPGSPRDNLVKALAIGLAVLDRIDHAPRDAGDVA